MPNVTVPAAATGLPSASLVTPSGQYDRAAILRAAHAEARVILAQNAAWGVIPPWRYALALKHGLRHAWTAARVQHDCTVRDAELAAMDTETARLVQARERATYIDNTVRMLATVAAIDAQLADLRVAA